MYEWNESVQRIIDMIEGSLNDEITLLDISRKTGYSPCYCSTKFHEITGMTIRAYISKRRLAKAAIEIRDSGKRIIDIAVKYGFSSQETLTRAFTKEFGCTPAAYRKAPVPIALKGMQVVFEPLHYSQIYGNAQGGTIMSKDKIYQAHMQMEYIPPHRYIGIFDDKAENYGEFWQYHDCDKICGIIESMGNVSGPVIEKHTAGWRLLDGKHKYFYGLGVPEDYDGPVPEGFEIRDMPGSYYMVFYHSAFDYLSENCQVMSAVESLAWSYDPTPKGYVYNEEECCCYQRHYPEALGYQILRPVKKI